ncbi:FXYD domain containing ion transport regulator 5 [Scleropages formosus]|uniref:FXYD domain containing ion transport regulator 5 n=1 Tax=Scleropages formosus TaxID=113540 RepID=UPI0010FA72C4|nr:uncharacterized protein LOC108930302 [Scleropages formosus]
MPLTHTQGVRMLLHDGARDHQKTSMGLKIHLSLFSLCLSVMFAGCSAESTSPFSLITSGYSHQAVTATTGPTPAYIENETHVVSNVSMSELYNDTLPEEDVTSAWTTQETSPANQNEAKTPEETTNTPTQAPSPSSVTRRAGRIPARHSTWDESWDTPFKYDYNVLRHVGLSLAAALFLMGIAVMTCGRVCRKPRCHVNQGKSYSVTRV